jgi:hypothetical protein
MITFNRQDRFSKIDDLLASQAFAINSLQRDMNEIRRRLPQP